MEGATILVKIISLVEGGQAPLEIVQRTVTEAPFAKLTTVAFGLFGDETVAPLFAPIIVQRPVPTEGVLPAKVNVPLLHCC